MKVGVRPCAGLLLAIALAIVTAGCVAGPQPEPPTILARGGTGDAGASPPASAPDGGVDGLGPDAGPSADAGYGGTDPHTGVADSAEFKRHNDDTTHLETPQPLIGPWPRDPDVLLDDAGAGSE